VDHDRLRIAAALLLTGPFVPLLFQGEEWAAATPFQYFTDHEDATLAEAIRIGRRREFAAFGWDPEAIPDPQAEDTYERSKLEWQETERAPHADMLQWYRELIALRRRIPALRAGTPTEVDVSEAAQALVIVRGTILIACNPSDDVQTVPGPAYGGAEILSSTPGTVVQGDAIVLPPHSVTIIDLHRQVEQHPTGTVQTRAA
jgi:maltooligosyltrehalose trehalohydrolase